VSQLNRGLNLDDMETSPYGAPTPGDPASHQPTDTIRLWKALDGLVGYGLSRDVILFMSKLGVAGVHRMLDVFEQEGREAVDGLLSSLEGVSEGTLRNWLDAIAGKSSFRTSTEVRGYAACGDRHPERAYRLALPSPRLSSAKKMD